MLRLLCCIACFSLCLYGYIHRHNQLTKLRIQLPPLTEEREEVEEKNARLAYDLGQTEHPEVLMHQLENFRHLHHPRRGEVRTLDVP